MISKIARDKNFIPVAASILLGLFLAKSMMNSAELGILILCLGAVLAVTVLMRKVDYLLVLWFILTSLVWPITVHLFPRYYSFLGTAIFWGLLICFMAGWTLNNIMDGRRFTRFEKLPIKAIVFFFLFWGAMSVYTSVDTYISVKRYSHIIIASCASYIFYDYFSCDSKKIKNVLVMLLYVVAGVSLSAVFVSFYSIAAGLPIYKQIDVWLLGPNTLGNMMCGTIPMIVVIIPFIVRNKGLRWGVIGLMVLALFFSFSRASWLGTAVAIMFLLLKSRLKISVWLAIIASVVVAAWIFPIVGDEAYDFITGYRFTGRKEIWGGSWKMAVEFPLLGVGPGNAPYLMEQYISNRAFAHFVGVENTHSIYLKNAAEMGFIGAFVWIVLVAALVYYFVKAEKNLESPFLKAVSRGGVATFIAMAVHGIFENGFFMTPFVAAEFQAVLPYIFCAMPFAAEQIEKNRRGRASKANQHPPIS